MSFSPGNNVLCAVGGEFARDEGRDLLFSVVLSFSDFSLSVLSVCANETIDVVAAVVVAVVECECECECEGGVIETACGGECVCVEPEGEETETDTATAAPLADTDTDAGTDASPANTHTHADTLSHTNANTDADIRFSKCMVASSLEKLSTQKRLRRCARVFHGF